MHFVCILGQTATCATYSINWLVFITEECVYCAVRVELNIIQVKLSTILNCISVPLTTCSVPQDFSWIKHRMWAELIKMGWKGANNNTNQQADGTLGNGRWRQRAAFVFTWRTSCRFWQRATAVTVGCTYTILKCGRGPCKAAWRAAVWTLPF
jgi:hypothetical protein